MHRNVTFARRHRRLWLAAERAGLVLLAGGMATMILGAALAPASLLVPYGLAGCLLGMAGACWVSYHLRGF